MKKKVLATCLAGTMLLGLVSTSALAVNVDQLVDVEKSDWFYPYVQYVAEQEYMEGIGGNKFAPEMEMSRAMFVTVLYRLDDPSGVSGESKFVDVPADTWYTEAVNWAVANGIVDGIGGNKFAPDSPITREQICTMMTRYLEYRAERDNKVYNSKNEEKIFPDADLISDYAKEAVKKCQMWGLMVGDDKGYINPANNATRAEIAAVIQRLDALLAAGEDVGGGEVVGGGGTVIPTPTPETASYTVKVTLEVPDSLSQVNPELLVSYQNVTIQNGTVSGDQTFGQVVNGLVNGENISVLNSTINEALEKVQGKTTTQTLNGQQVTVSISDDGVTDPGVISASVAVKVTDFTSDKTCVSQEELEALITKLQKGGNMEFSAADLPVMEALLTKIEEVEDMDLQEIQDKIDQVKDEKPELAQVVSGMTPDAILEAAGSYKEGLTQIKNEVQQAVESGATGPIVIKKKPVLMNVAMNLGAYYEQVVDKFESSRDTAIRNMETQLGLTFTADQKAKAGALYELNNPAHYVTNNKNGTLTLKSAIDYVALVRSNVAYSAAFYESLGQDEAFYKSLLQRMEDKYKDGYGVTYSQDFVDNMAALLGDKDSIFVDEAKAFRNDMTFFIEVTADEDTYESWLELISGKFSQAGNILPETMPSALSSLLGSYTLTFTIDKQ